MPENVQTASPSLLTPREVARATQVLTTANGLRYGSFGDTGHSAAELERVVGAVPAGITPAFSERVFYFVPLAFAQAELPPDLRALSPDQNAETVIAGESTQTLADEAICHRNVKLDAEFMTQPLRPAHEATFLSTRMLHDRFALAFELYINVGHAFVDFAGVPESFERLAWSQAQAGVRGETSQDAHEARQEALGLIRGNAAQGEAATTPVVDEHARAEFGRLAFADALAIYQLSLALDFDYSELREREYPLLQSGALADRLREVARLFPPNPGYEFAIRYRRRA